jgi:uncharacterized protein YecT (DUF1311 family)
MARSIMTSGTGEIEIARRSRMAVAELMLLLSFCVAAPAMADEDVDCAHAADTPTILECAGDEFGKADDELNAVYKQAMASQVATDKQLAGTSIDVGAASALRKAQRAWITYRDAHCEAIAFQDAGGTARPIDEVVCETDLTRERIKRLKDLIGGGD